MILHKFARNQLKVDLTDLEVERVEAAKSEFDETLINCRALEHLAPNLST